MADTLLLDVGASSKYQEAAGSHRNTVWLSQTVGYRFSIDSTAATLRLVYQKTTTGPTGFGAAVRAGSADSVRRFAIWWDQWTKGDSGTVIHFAWVEDINDDVWYRNLDTATDTLSTAVQVFNGTSVDAAAQLSQGDLTIGKPASNLLVVHARLDDDGENVDRYSTDGGSTWNTHTATVYGSNTSSVQYIGAFSATEYALLHLNRADGVLTLKRVSTSSIVSTSATLATLTVDDGYFPVSGTMRWSDGAFLINYVTSQSTAAATFGAIEISAAGTVTHKTNVKSSVEMSQSNTAFIDQNTDRWWVGYFNGTAAGSVIAVYAFSDDGGDTWTVDRAYGETTDTLAGIDAGYCVPAGLEGRFSPTFFNRDLLDVLINTGVAIDVPLDQVSYQVKIFEDDQTTLVYDSGIIKSAVLSHTMPGDWAGVDATNYEIQVTVVDSNGATTVSAFSRFTLDLPEPPPADPPVITSIDPSEGVENGGTAVTITGTDFDAAATVTIGGAALADLLVINSTTITGTTPAGTVGAQDVVVTHPDGQFDTLVDGFTYTLEPSNDPHTAATSRRHPWHPIHPKHPSVR